MRGTDSHEPDIRPDYKLTFSTDSGHRVLDHILHEGYADRAFPMGNGAVDPVKLAMAEGARRLALTIKRHFDEGCKLSEPAQRYAEPSLTTEERANA